ncbi:uncharacterized protein [Antedon mediterranea]|uniref:uncharacterized protein n=1 Tax=Antedon mediterranea TaxID=105859 RepID=UPI003AF65790
MEYEINESVIKHNTVTTYAQIAELGAGSVFGLETVLRKSKNKLSLVSEGCHCILVSKKFFKNENTIKMLQTINTMAINFPQPKETLTKIREGRAWYSFKDTLVTEVLEGKSKKVMSTLSNVKGNSTK